MTRTASLAALLALGVALAGCATASRQPPPPPPAPPPPALPVAPPAPPQAPPASELKEGFFFNKDGKTASLAYGPPDSDSVALMLNCRRGSGRVQIMDSAHAEAKAGQALVLASGQARSELPAAVEADEESGGNIASARAPISLPALQAFRTSGKITLTMGQREIALTASEAEKGAIGRFFAFCEPKR